MLLVHPVHLQVHPALATSAAALAAVATLAAVASVAAAAVTHAAIRAALAADAATLADMGQWLWLCDGRAMRPEHGVRRWYELPQQRSMHDPQPASGAHLGHEFCGRRFVRLEFILYVFLL